MSDRHFITGTAKVGPIEMRLFPFRREFVPPDGGYDMPWCVGAICRIEFTIGELKASKRVSQKYTWNDRLGWPKSKRPSDADIEAAKVAVLNNLRTHIQRHGFDPGPLAAELKDGAALDRDGERE